MPNPTPSEPAKPKTSDVSEGGMKEYLIASVRGPQAQANGMQPMSAMQLQSTIGSINAIKVKRTVPRHGATAPMSMVAGEAADVFVAEIDPAAAPVLRQQAPSSGLIVEPNEPLDYVGMSPLRAPSFAPPTSMAGNIAPVRVQIRVLGPGETPVADANVMLQGDGFMQTGKTSAKGDVALDLWCAPGSKAKYLWVKPKANYWDRYIATPNLQDGTINVVRLQAFGETIPGFPNNFGYGWGQKMMGLLSRPDFARGQGIKIAVIDSGADTAHPLLSHIKFGLDASTDALQDGWKNDTIGHGSHVAGVITANGGGGTMFTGFAPEAEVHVIKVFPGGYDSLIQALNYCIAKKIDVVNMSLGGTEVSVAVDQVLQEAAIAGVACIVAAGNSGDAVKYPASSPNSLAVGAVGAMTETRAQSWAQTQIIAESIAADGIYPARFSCHGPEVGVVAPGVSIVSTMPNNSFGVDDGTSMAAPHVTGLAALLLAHHPLFTSTFTQRNRERVSALFSILRQLCTPYGFPDARAGSGLPILAEPTARVLVPGATLAPSSAATGNAANTPVQPAGSGETLHTLSAAPSMTNAPTDGNVNQGRQPIYDLPTQPGHWISQMQPYGIVLIPAIQSPGSFYPQYLGAGRI